MKKSVISLLIFLFIILCFNFVSATNVTLTGYNSTFAIINITNAVNLYSYEINFDYNGNSVILQDAGFLISDEASAVGISSNIKNDILSVYDSRLDNTDSGIDGTSDYLFNLSYSGTLTLRYALFVNSSGGEEYIYFNSSAEPSCGDNVCNGGETCSSCAADCGSCAASTPAGATGGDFVPTEKANLKPNFAVYPESLDIELSINESNAYGIRVVNLGSNRLIVSVNSNLKRISGLPGSLELSASGSETIILDIDSSTAGTDFGKIVFSYGNYVKEVPVSVTVNNPKNLFDFSVSINKSIANNKIDARIDLNPLIEKTENVTINYYIKNLNGIIVYQFSESVMLSKETFLNKNFDVSFLKDGEYVLVTEVIYSDNIAFSSSQFKVKKNLIGKAREYWIGIVIAIIGVIVLVSFAVKFIIKKIRHKKHKHHK